MGEARKKFNFLPTSDPQGRDLKPGYVNQYYLSVENGLVRLAFAYMNPNDQTAQPLWDTAVMMPQELLDALAKTIATVRESEPPKPN